MGVGERPRGALQAGHANQAEAVELGKPDAERIAAAR
jgi:hypothetical protein